VFYGLRDYGILDLLVGTSNPLENFDPAQNSGTLSDLPAFFYKNS